MKKQRGMKKFKWNYFSLKNVEFQNAVGIYDIQC